MVPYLRLRNYYTELCNRRRVPGTDTVDWLTAHRAQTLALSEDIGGACARSNGTHGPAGAAPPGSRERKPSPESTAESGFPW